MTHRAGPSRHTEPPPGAGTCREHGADGQGKKRHRETQGSPGQGAGPASRPAPHGLPTPARSCGCSRVRAPGVTPAAGSDEREARRRFGAVAARRVLRGRVSNSGITALPNSSTVCCHELVRSRCCPDGPMMSWSTPIAVPLAQRLGAVLGVADDARAVLLAGDHLLARRVRDLAPATPAPTAASGTCRGT